MCGSCSRPRPKQPKQVAKTERKGGKFRTPKQVAKTELKGGKLRTPKQPKQVAKTELKGSKFCTIKNESGLNLAHPAQFMN